MENFILEIKWMAKVIKDKVRKVIQVLEKKLLIENTLKIWMEKALLQSKFFPAKISFSKIQKKNLAGKNLLCKETRSNFNDRKVLRKIYKKSFTKKLWKKSPQITANSFPSNPNSQLLHSKSNFQVFSS